MQPRNPLTALFSPTRRLIGPDAPIVQRGGLLGVVQWIVPRADCHYARIDFRELTPRQRPPAARIAVARMMPTVGAASRIGWLDGIAHVWTWTAASEHGIKEDAWLPESLLRPRSFTDGPQLIRAVHGFEGQCWSQGQLYSSQWWPSCPDLEIWTRFLRSSGVDAEQAGRVPQPQSLPWLQEPWASVMGANAGSSVRLEHLAWITGLGAISLALGWQLASLEAWKDATEVQRQEIEQLRAKSMPVLESRELAEAARSTLESYRDIQQAPSDYVLIAEVISRLPRGALIKAWEREAEKLLVGVVTDVTDPRRIISAFEGHEALGQVVATPVEGGGMRLEFRLPAPAPRDVAVATTELGVSP